MRFRRFEAEGIQILGEERFRLWPIEIHRREILFGLLFWQLLLLLLICTED